MKPFFFVAIVFAFLLAGGISVSAQRAAPMPPPAPVPDYFPAQWKEFSFAEDNIRFRFPVEPKREVLTVRNDESWSSYNRNAFMVFNLTVMPISADRDRNADGELLEHAVQGGLNALKDRKPRILEQKDLLVDGHAAKFLAFETNDGLIMRLKCFAKDNKIYIAQAATEKGKRHGFNSENDFEVIAMAFLDSVRPIETK